MFSALSLIAFIGCQKPVDASKPTSPAPQAEGHSSETKTPDGKAIIEASYNKIKASQKAAGIDIKTALDNFSGSVTMRHIESNSPMDGAVATSKMTVRKDQGFTMSTTNSIPATGQPDMNIEMGCLNKRCWMIMMDQPAAEAPLQQMQTQFDEMLKDYRRMMLDLPDFDATYLGQVDWYGKQAHKIDVKYKTKSKNLPDGIMYYSVETGFSLGSEVEVEVNGVKSKLHTHSMEYVSTPVGLVPSIIKTKSGNAEGSITYGSIEILPPGDLIIPDRARELLNTKPTESK